MRGSIAYAGAYRREGDTVIHVVETSLFPNSFPNWVGSEQRREIAWEGDRLILSTPPTAAGVAPTVHRLVWERAHPARQAVSSDRQRRARRGAPDHPPGDRLPVEPVHHRAAPQSSLGE
jgi:hypothetical protein